MKPIINDSKLPKFLIVTEAIEQWSLNKYLIKPFVKGEIVKVHSDQTPSKNSDLSNITFKKNFVRVTRKHEGEWNLIYVHNWTIFDLLITTKK